MRILFISSFYLFRDTRFGGTKRLYYFAKEWEKRADLSLICMDACAEWAAAPAAEPEFKDFLMVPGTEPAGLWDRVMKAPADRRKFLAPHHSAIRAFLRAKRFDVILLAYPWSLSFLGPLLDGIDAPIVFLEDDLVIEQFRSAAGSEPSVLRSLLKRYRYRQTRGYYRPRMEKVVRFIGISLQEAAIMGRLFPWLRTDIIKYGLPLAEFPFLPPAQDAGLIGFIGNYRHLPNLDAVEWLRTGLIPAIRALNPDARFLIAGHGMPEALKSLLAADPLITVRESVADLADFYRGIAIFINPVRTGRGLRTKVLEASAFGRRVLTTTLGGEGLQDLEMNIADDATSMARACAGLLAGAGAGQADRNRRTVEDKYALEKVAADFLAILGAVRT
jgi:polysaccharide biosynthesis protein PslH